MSLNTYEVEERETAILRAMVNKQLQHIAEKYTGATADACAAYLVGDMIECVCAAVPREMQEIWCDQVIKTAQNLKDNPPSRVS